jgi:hypothetical protein
MTAVLERGSSFVRDLGEAARENPVSAVLIGMGVLWMFGGSAAAVARSTVLERAPNPAGGLTDAKNAAMDAGERFGGAAASATERLQSNASAALEGATRFGRERAETLSQYAKSLPTTGAEMMNTVNTVRSTLTDLFKAQPLALGAVGFAIGAGIAAAVPPTKAEAEYLGEASAALKEKAKQFASDQSARAAGAADEAFNAATGEARRQGFTVEAAKSAANDVSKKVSRVADAARKGISEMNPNSR